MRRVGKMAIAAAALLAATSAPATAAKRPRPTAVPPAQVVSAVVPNAFQVFNDYATPARSYASRRAVVHYVVLGVDAPPLNDDDADGVPDYVERVGDAADTSIAYYERRGFAPISADAGGLDARPDLYISRFAPGSFGVAFPSSDAEGGAFVAVSNASIPARRRVSEVSTAPSPTSSSTSLSSRTSRPRPIPSSPDGRSRGWRRPWRAGSSLNWTTLFRPCSCDTGSRRRSEA